MFDQSPKSIFLKDFSIQSKLLQRPKKMRDSLKAQMLNISFSKKPPQRKGTLPEIQGQERKQLNKSKSISKTLPYIKPSDPEPETKHKKSIGEMPSNDPMKILGLSSAICMKKIPSSSMIKAKGHTKSDIINYEIKVEVTACDNILSDKQKNAKKGSTQLLNVPDLAPNSLLSQLPIPSKCSSTRTLSPIRCSPITERGSGDPFYYLNILKNINFSPFNAILEGIIDAHCNSFPYYSRIIKNFLKIKPVTKTLMTHSPKPYHKCTCPNAIQYKKKNCINSLINITNIRQFIPNLVQISYTPQSARFCSNIIILNFEGVLGSCTSELYIKPGILKNIKKLSRLYRVVLVLSSDNQKVEKVLEMIQSLEISLSGVYYSFSKNNKNKEVNKLQDYSLIYQDYNIHKPDTQVLIISHHNYIEDINSKNQEIVYIKTGICKKLNAYRVPVPTFEYPKCPYTMLLPNFQIKKTSDILDKLVQTVKSIEHSDHFLDNFYSLIKLSQCLSVKSSAVYETLIGSLELNKSSHFKPHKKITQSENFSHCELHQTHSIASGIALYYNKFIFN